MIKNMNRVKTKLLYPNSIIPRKTMENDACYDVFATSKEDLGDGRIKYGLGLAFELPELTQLDLRARSSIHKTGLVLSNSIGTGDEGYRGEYFMVFYHVIPTLKAYDIGDRIGQIQVSVREDITFILTDELSSTDRGDGGFGSTGR